MTRLSYVALFLTVLAFQSCEDDSLQRAKALNDEVLRLATQESYWPGFNPAAVPLAIFDGTTTYLFRHPAPPEGFVEEAGPYMWQGRHSSVIANSSAPIGGIPTATVIANPVTDTLSRCERAAVVIHEAFHVFQATTASHWRANEVDLFIYPVRDADLLALSRLETQALRRALEKLADRPGLPKLVGLERRFSCYRALRKMGGEAGDVVVLAQPSEVVGCMKKVPAGKVTTIVEICKAIARRESSS